MEQWPIPSLDLEFQATWKQSPSVYEYTAQLLQVKSMVNEFHDWGLLCSTLLLNALWCQFYITGNKKYIHRIIDVAVPWSAFMDKLGVEFIVDQQKELPESIRVCAFTVAFSVVGCSASDAYALLFAVCLVRNRTT